MYLLDTDVLSALRRPERAPNVRHWLAQQSESDLHLSAITLGEIVRGIVQQRRRDPGFADDLQAWVDATVTLFGDRVLPFGPAEARIWGRLSAEIGNTSADLMIAATGLATGATVITGNARHFEPTGVRVVDPF